MTEDLLAPIEGGSIVVTATIHSSAQQEAVNAILGRYAVDWRLVVVS